MEPHGEVAAPFVARTVTALAALDGPVPGGGFVVETGSVRTAARQLAGVAESGSGHHRGEFATSLTSHRRGGEPVLVRPAPAAPVWLAGVEREWNRGYDQLLVELDAAALALHTTANAYTAVDQHLAEAMTAIVHGLRSSHAEPFPAAGLALASLTARPVTDRPRPGSPHSPERIPECGPGHGPGHGPSTSGPAALDAGTVAPSVTVHEAFDQWRTRLRVVEQLCGEVTGLRVEAPGWLGDAATGYRSWLTAHHHRWAALAQDAHRVLVALDRLDSHPPTLTFARATTPVPGHPEGGALPAAPRSATEFTSPWRTDESRDAHAVAADPTPRTPVTTAGHTAGEAPSATPRPPTGDVEAGADHSSLSHPGTGDTGNADSSDGTPDQSAPSGDTDGAGDRDSDSATGNSGTATGAGGAVTGQPGTGGAAAGGAVWAGAAAAAAVTLARQDRARLTPYVDITAPPTAPTAPARPTLGPTPGHQATTGVPTPPIAVPGALAGSRSPARLDTPQRAGNTSAAGVGDRRQSIGRHAGHRLLGDPRDGRRAGMDGPAPDALGWWLPLGQQHDRTAWFNLAATGIGLTGSGATDIIRTLLVRLLDHTTAATVVTPAATLTELLDLPDDPSPDLADHLARLLADDLLNPTTSPQPAHRLHLTPTPFTALQAVEDELHRRFTDPGTVTAPWLLLVPAPTTDTARHRLQSLLADGHAHHLHAAVLGPWPVGWSCHIDDQHRITQHTPPAPATPPHTQPALLIGAHLAPTSSAELREHLSAFSDDDAGFPAPHSQRPGTDVSASAAPTAHRSPRDENSGREPAGRDAGSRASDGTDQGSGGTDNSPAPVTPFHLSVLGPTALTYRAAPTPDDPEPPARPINQLGPRATELLIYLAAHPGGVHRDSLVATLWPDAHPERPTNALHATLGRIRRTLHDLTAQSATTTPGGPSNGAGTETVLHNAADPSSTQTDPTDIDLTALVQHDGDRYRLHPQLVTVDYWAFLIACTHLTDPDTTTRAHHCNIAITAYRGPLGTDLASEWLISLREHTRRRYFDALDTLARITIHVDPERTLDLLETARNLEPLKEGIYRDLMRIQCQLGRHDAALRTYELLETQLADIDEYPDKLTHALLHTIRAHQQQVDDALTRSEPQQVSAALSSNG